MIDCSNLIEIPDPRKATMDLKESCHRIIDEIFRGAYDKKHTANIFRTGNALFICQNEETGWPMVYIIKPRDDGDKH